MIDIDAWIAYLYIESIIGIVSGIITFYCFYKLFSGTNTINTRNAWVAVVLVNTLLGAGNIAFFYGYVGNYNYTPPDDDDDPPLKKYNDIGVYMYVNNQTLTSEIASWIYDNIKSQQTIGYPIYTVDVLHTGVPWNDSNSYVWIWLFPDGPYTEHKAYSCNLEYLLDVSGVFDYLDYRYATYDQETLNYDLYKTWMNDPTSQVIEANLTTEAPSGRSGWLIDLNQ